MKKLLVIRFPGNWTAEEKEVFYLENKTELFEYNLLVYTERGIERVEFEIVYDPYFKPDVIA